MISFARGESMVHPADGGVSHSGRGICEKSAPSTPLNMASIRSMATSRTSAASFGSAPFQAKPRSRSVSPSRRSASIAFGFLDRAHSIPSSVTTIACRPRWRPYAYRCSSSCRAIDFAPGFLTASQVSGARAGSPENAPPVATRPPTAPLPLPFRAALNRFHFLCFIASTPGRLQPAGSPFVATTARSRPGTRVSNFDESTASC
jgi:hypothetical protein